MDHKKLCNKIKLARKALDLTQAALAERVQTRQKSISIYENAVSLPSLKTLVKIAKALKKPTAHFIGE